MYCTSCGSRLTSNFCTFCGHPAGAPGAAATTAPALSQTQAIPPSAATPATPANPASAASGIPSAAATESPTAAAPAPEPAPIPSPEPSPQAYADSSTYTPAQQPSGSGSIGTLVLVLVLVIILAGAGAWYFWGVETIVVSSPPNVKVFLDDKEVAPTSYGRYVIPHLSRKPHLLKVQSPGFADTLQRLDFPLTSSREWVNIRLVPSPAPRPSLVPKRR
ncbi:MAG TPA: hypothetical protein VIB39_15770 [Candidatus Angelobacter sp.]